MNFSPQQHVRPLDVRTKVVLEREERLRNIITMLLDAIEMRKDQLHTASEVEENFQYVVPRARKAIL